MTRYGIQPLDHSGYQERKTARIAAEKTADKRIGTERTEHGVTLFATSAHRPAFFRFRLPYDGVRHYYIPNRMLKDGRIIDPELRAYIAQYYDKTVDQNTHRRG